ncbi:AbrB/MazE/SpoVT family DNA-binding domain-containing protein [Synechocystis salina LEGE 06155]|nr:AbrB/MazE/SpoVT family DNA-binding domain-containing protein [Synechocystis salina LEGE 06155]
MDIPLRKWGNSLGLRIPHKLVESLAWDENCIVEVQEMEQTLVIRKKTAPLELDQLLASIPADFQYPEDAQDFVDSPITGQEMI